MPPRKKSKKRNPKERNPNPKSSTSRTAKKRRVARGKRRTLKAVNKKPSRKKSAIRKKSARKKSATRSGGRAKKSSVNTARELAQELRNQRRTRAPRSSQQVDFEGLSRSADADSESVEELVEEGNAFEAGAVEGVEEAEESDGREVHTHEVPEDDVPDEYLDRD